MTAAELLLARVLYLGGLPAYGSVRVYRHRSASPPAAHTAHAFIPVRRTGLCRARAPCRGTARERGCTDQKSECEKPADVWHRAPPSELGDRT
jgi:hypothetical protein